MTQETVAETQKMLLNIVSLASTSQHSWCHRSKETLWPRKGGDPDHQCNFSIQILIPTSITLAWLHRI